MDVISDGTVLRGGCGVDVIVKVGIAGVLVGILVVDGVFVLVGV